MYGRENQNILIEGNVIRNCAYEAMELTCAKGLVVRNNTVEYRHPDYNTNAPAILIDKVDGAEIYGNILPKDWDTIYVTTDTSNVIVK